MKLKRIIGTILIAAAPVVMTGCNQPDQSSNPPPATNAASPPAVSVPAVTNMPPGTNSAPAGK
jgi:hypothetical protein